MTEPTPDSFRPSAEPWTEDRLDELGPYEHDFQEFKSSPWVSRGGKLSSTFLFSLSKQLSAFANNAGGHLFLGIDDDGQIDGGVPVDLRANGTREWLEDVVPGLVGPRLALFNVYEIRGTRELSLIHPGHAVYVIEIPPSRDAPHQALDYRYYLRIAGKSRPMGHVNIEDVLRRTRTPRVMLARVGQYGEPEYDTGDSRGPRVFVGFRAFLRNEGRSLGRHVGAEIILPRPLIGGQVRRRNTTPAGVEYSQTPGEIWFFRYHPVPLFPSQEIFFLHFWIGLHAANRDLVRSGNATLRWRVYADDAPPNEGGRAFSEFGVVQRAMEWLDTQERDISSLP